MFLMPHSQPFGTFSTLQFPARHTLRLTSNMSSRTTETMNIWQQVCLFLKNLLNCYVLIQKLNRCRMSLLGAHVASNLLS